MSTHEPEPVNEEPALGGTVEVRGGDSPLDYMPSWDQMISKPAEGCGHLGADCDCETE